MSSILSLFMVMVTAAVVENVLFARALGTSQLMDRTREPKGVLMLGAAMAVLNALSALVIHLVGRLEMMQGLRQHHRALVYMACISAVYVAVCLALRQWRPEVFTSIKGLLSGVAFSGSVLGIQIVAGSEYGDLWSRLAYAVGGALGLMVALLMIISARERLNFSKVPRSFAGLPILLIYIGILSLAIYGLIGHPLAV